MLTVDCINIIGELPIYQLHVKYVKGMLLNAELEIE
jgi:hypothetical protein